MIDITQKVRFFFIAFYFSATIHAVFRLLKLMTIDKKKVFFLISQLLLFLTGKLSVFQTKSM